MFGQHDDPYAVISRLSAHLHGTQPLDVIRPAVAESIAETLKLPYVAIATGEGNGTLITEYGIRDKRTELATIPPMVSGTQIGALRAGARERHEPISKSDLRTLCDLARQVSITVYAAQLTGEVQTSRERLITAREEERRPIDRDLYDGLGPTLAALRLQLGALRRLIRQNPAEAEARVDELGREVRAVTAEIRRLVYDLPPAIARRVRSDWRYP